MDIPRPERQRRKRIRQFVIGGVVVACLAVVTQWVVRLEPAAPTVSRASVWVDSVREGEMLRQVRGNGALVPREIRWVATQTDGRVERVLVRPGAEVSADTVLVELSNPDLMQMVEEARIALEGAEAELAEMQLRLQSQQLDQRVALAAVRSEFESHRLQAEAEAVLAAEGIVAQVQFRRSELLVEQYALRLEAEQERHDRFAATMEAQLATQRSRMQLASNTWQRRKDQVDSLRVRAGIAGVLQQVEVEEGQRATLGANIARVARPDELQAELRVPETQARDVQHGQPVRVDTRNGIVEGRVVRIDPAVQSGTVQVDVELTGVLPRGARPDLSVDGVIEIERLAHVVFTGRPAYGQSNSTISLFKLVEDGRYAIRVPVELGRTSVNTVEILNGLVPGDQVILSDTSAWERYDRIRLN